MLEKLTRKTLQQIIDKSNSLLAYLDPEFNFVAVNAAYAQGCHRTPEELIGQNHFHFYPNADNEAIFQRVKETGEPVSFVDRPFVYPDQPERGVTYWDWTLSPVTDESGCLEGLVLSLVETTPRKKAALDLERMRNMLAEAQKIAHLGSFEYDIAARQAIWSDEEYHIFGLLPQGPLPTLDRMLTCIHPDDVIRFQQAFTSAIECGSAYEQEFRVVHPDGSVRWAQDRAVPCRDAHGQVVRYIGTTLDITECKRMEEQLRKANDGLEATVQARTAELSAANAALRAEIVERQRAEKDRLESETNCRSVLETINAGVILQAASGEILLWNKGAEEIFGLPAISSVGQTSESRNWQMIHEDGSTYAGIDHPSMRTLRTGVPCRNEIMGLYRATGELRWLSVNTTSLFLPEGGRPYAVAISFSDITEIKKVAASLRQSEARLQLALGAANLGWWHYDPLSKITHYDLRYSEIIGVSGNQRPNDEILQLLHPQDLPGVCAKVEAALDPSNPQSYCAEYRIFSTDGSLRWVEAHWMTIFEGEGRSRQAVSLVGTVQDVTERNRTEAELKEKSEHLSDINAALRALLRQREEDKQALEESVMGNIRYLVLPYLDSLKKSQLTHNQHSWVEALETNLNQSTSTFTRKMTLQELNLSNAELRVAALVRDGKSTKEIAHLLITSEKTVSSHRDSIRNKLGLRGKKGGLRYLLMNLG